MSQKASVQCPVSSFKPQAPIIESAAHPQLTVQWNDLRRELRKSGNGKGGLVVRLPQKHLLTWTENGAKRTGFDGTFNEYGVIYAQAAAECELIIEHDGQEVQRIRWKPCAARADSLFVVSE